MRFNIDGRLFQQQLQAVNKVINSKNALSILDNFLFELDNGILTITGSDQENIVSVRAEVLDSEGTGAVAVPAKTIIEITKEVSNQPLTFNLNESTGEIDIVFLTGNFKFMGVNADEYPRGEKIDEDATTLIIPSSVVKKGIENTIYAVSLETIRPMMTGIFWDIHEGDITFVASDTHKLVRYINSEVNPEVKTSFIMPAKPASIIKGILDKEESDVKMVLGAKGAQFEFGYYTITSLVKFEIADNQMKLSAQDLDYGTSAKETVLCEYEGNDITIGFNSQFTLEILNNIKGSDVVIRLSDPARPGIFEPLEQEPNQNLVTIQMPLQVIE